VLPLGEGHAAQDADMLLSIFLLGLLGATISATFSLMATRGRFRIPEAIAAFLMTIMRVSIGGVSALAIYFLFKSELYQDVLNIQIASLYSFLVLAFISGFSERFVKRALDAAAKALGAGEEKKQEGK
jgi:uncharacterized SAM-binding protein YcdF (DUF218 family)